MPGVPNLFDHEPKFEITLAFGSKCHRYPPGTQHKHNVKGKMEKTLKIQLLNFSCFIFKFEILHRALATVGGPGIHQMDAESIQPWERRNDSVKPEQASVIIHELKQKKYFKEKSRRTRSWKM